MDQRCATLINALACRGSKGVLFFADDLVAVLALLSAAEQKIEACKAG